MPRDDLAINEEVQSTADVPANPAQADFAVWYVAVSRAGCASNSPVGKLPVQECFFTNSHTAGLIAPGCSGSKIALLLFAVRDSIRLWNKPIFIPARFVRKRPYAMQSLKGIQRLHDQLLSVGLLN